MEANKKRFKKKNVFSVLNRGIMVKYFKVPWPMWVDFRITYRCNLRCGYCDMPNIKMEEMTTDEVKRVIDKINAPGRVILLTGGEPLVRKDIGEVVRYFVYHSDCEVRFNTNLILLKKRYEEIKDCDGFFFSLDGTKETHERNKGEGSWKGVEEALDILHRDRRGKISMTVITRNTTLDDLKFVLDTCSKYDILPAFQQVRHYKLSHHSKEMKPETDHTVNLFEYLYEQRKSGFVMMNSKKGLLGQISLAKGTLDAQCYSGKLFCSIDSDGIVGLCFSRPRHADFLNLRNDNVGFSDAIAALKTVKPHTIRCADCTCMAPIEFSLCNLINFDVLFDTYLSEKRYQTLEENYVKRLNERFAVT
ncbi:MAG: radical SAM protein [Spirochaetales bacterium]|nr:radical SAM protein [Spirochaetales bacterium]